MTTARSRADHLAALLGPSLPGRMFRGRALTILQPSAQAILEGVKPWENREAPAPSTIELGEWIALHTGVALWPFAPRIRALWPGCPADADLPMGVVIGAWRFDRSYAMNGRLIPLGRDGVATERDLRTGAGLDPADHPWAFGPYCLRVGAVVRLAEPVASPGFHQGWWFLTDDAALTVATAIESAPRLPGEP